MPGRTRARTFGTARRSTALTASATAIAMRSRRSGPAPFELARVDVHTDERKDEQEERRLDDRVRDVVDRPACDRLGAGCSHSLQTAQVGRDATRRARHGQVDELERRLKHDAGQEREWCRDPSSHRDA